MPALNDIIEERLKDAEQKGVRRRLHEVVREAGPYIQHAGARLLNFSSNDYLGLRAHPAVIEAAQAALSEAGTGGGASRLVCGNHSYYAPLEQALSDAKHTEAALVFGSGYLANIGVIAALMGESDLILADKLAHACMLDGAKLSGVTLKRFAHNDMAHLEQMLTSYRGKHRHCLILSETVFSMDGDLAPCAALATLAAQHDAWLMLDDAHGLGFVEPVKADMLTGTLSKALGGYGGYVAGSRTLIEYLISHARSFIFTTSLPPATIAAASAALGVMQREPERAERALGYARKITHALRLPEAQSPIVPVIIGEVIEAVRVSDALRARGFWVAAIRPPTVLKGTARLRISCTASHEESHIEALIAALKEVL